MSTKTSIQPLNSYVLCIQRKSGLKTKSNLYLPDSAQKKTAFADVMAIGADVKTVAIGDCVLFKQFTDQEFTHQGVDYILIEEVDILAKVTE